MNYKSGFLFRIYILHIWCIPDVFLPCNFISCTCQQRSPSFLSLACVQRWAFQEVSFDISNSLDFLDDIHKDIYVRVVRLELFIIMRMKWFWTAIPPLTVFNGCSCLEMRWIMWCWAYISTSRYSTCTCIYSPVLKCKCK